MCFNLLLLMASLCFSYGMPIVQQKQQQNVGTKSGGDGGIELPPKLLFEKSCQKIFSFPTAAHVIHAQGGCACTKDWRSVKCCCVGQGIRQIPLDMAGPGRAKAVSTIYFFDVSLGRLTPASFAAFPNLEEIFLDRASLLAHVDSRAFSGLKKLRKITISNCPALVSWTGVMLRENAQIQTLAVLNSGALRELPLLEMGPQHSLPMERIDFSGNCIAQIGEGALRNVQAKTVSFADNAPCLRAITGNAFPASKFVELHLSANPSLDYIAETAFAGLAHIEHLDMSQTDITALPFTGLRSLKQLTLKDVPRLKVLPPVLAFPNLVRAEFTYAHHCCFFKYATRDYYERKGIGGKVGIGGAKSQTRELDENFRAIQRRVCRRRQTVAPEGAESVDHGQSSRSADADHQENNNNRSSSGAAARRRRRQSRHIVAHDPAGDKIFKQLAEWYRNMELQQQQQQRRTAGNGSSGAALATGDTDEPAPYGDDEIGKSFLLKRCDGTAVDNFYLNLSCSPRPDALNPCEDIVSHLPLRVMIWVMWVGAIFGNLGVWVVICAAWQRKMRLHYVFMLNLSFADFLTGVYLAILAVADLRTANEYYTFAVEWQTGWGCAVAGFLSVFATELSTFSMLMIATEIYYNSRYAFYGRRFGPISATAALIGGYAYSLLMAALPLFGVSSYERSSICLPLHINSSLDRAYILFGLALSGLAFLAMIIIYVLLNCMLRRNQQQCNRERAEEDKQILRRTLVLIGTDILCWLPTLFFGVAQIQLEFRGMPLPYGIKNFVNFFGFTAALGRPLITLSSAKWCLVLFYPINSCANPLLYVFLTRIWRDAKRKSAAVLRRSLANAGAGGGTLSLHRFELFYATAPNGQRRGSGPAALALGQFLRRLSAPYGHDNVREEDCDDDEEEDEEEETEEDERIRSNTVHCCEGDEQRIKMMALKRTNNSKNSNNTGTISSTSSSRSSGSGASSATTTTTDRRKARRASADDSRRGTNGGTSTLNASSGSSRNTVKMSGPSSIYTKFRRKSQPELDSSAGHALRVKISAPPQMSDISESSTASMSSRQTAEKAGGAGTNCRKLVARRREAAAAEHLAGAATANSPPAEASGDSDGATRNGNGNASAQKRPSNASSGADCDSGHGDSFRSWTSKTKRPSVVTMCWEKPPPLVRQNAGSSDSGERDDVDDDIGVKQSQHQLLLLRLSTAAET
ncbi:hypothetical protein niasHS_005335 [Heterodera schachtii]|uniref:G-protein coupled receptors family 1 profile domain-containing protein n=2 Tax=Heterodera TaxID=34509 RepID=A0ABD2J925_HETSC